MSAETEDVREYVQARQVAQAYFAAIGVEAETPFFEFLGEGLSYAAWVSEIFVDGEYGGEIVVRVPVEDGEEDQAESAWREQRLRTWLRKRPRELSFHVPAIRWVEEASHGLAIVEDYADGFPLDALQPERFDIVGITADVAASIHNLDVTTLPDSVQGYDTRQAHALAWIARFDAIDAPEAVEARAWAEDHLPADGEPSRLLHGDLLGQNIIVETDDRWRDVARIHVIDWEAAMRGDPAYDLAIVSRAYRKPLGGTIDAFVDRYVEASNIDVTVAHLRIYELGLRAKWYVEVLEEEGDTAHAEQRFKDFTGLLRRAKRRS